MSNTIEVSQNANEDRESGLSARRSPLGNGCLCHLKRRAARHSGTRQINDIIPLERERWQDYRLDFHYVSHYYYDVEINHSADDFHVSFVKKPFSAPYEKLPDDTDKLFQPWWDDIRAWGIVENGHLAAAIETSAEGWSNRLRVTELWIDERYRRRGIATALMDIALKRAKDEKRRALMLETQSCNEGAIAFYFAYGFSIIGFDTCAYSNNDLKRKEVRMEMGMLLE